MDVLEVLLGYEELLTIEDVMDKTEHTGPGATEEDNVLDKNPSEPKSTPSIEVSYSCPAEGCLERFRWRPALLEHWRLTHEALVLKFQCPFHRCPYQHVKRGQVARHLYRVHQRQSRDIIIQGRLGKNHKFKKPGMTKDVASFLRLKSIQGPLVGDILWREEYICMDETVDIRGEEVFLHYRRGNGCPGKLTGKTNRNY